MSLVATYTAERLLWPEGRVGPATVVCEDGIITAVSPGIDPRAELLPGLVIPGLADVHSHAFHRALRARAEEAGADFWGWREAMYALADRLDPERYLALARGVYAEMALAGVTAVGEFHYLHHDRDGRHYADPNAMGEALMEAAAEAGVRLTLLDTCYLTAGIDGSPPTGVQRRFCDGDVDAWAARAAARRGAAHVKLGAAIHSVRAVPQPALKVVASWAAERNAPLHFHLSEQPAENERCIAVTGCTPRALLEDAGALGRRSTAVHATHVGGEDVARLGRSGTAVCLCPTTERALADGVGPAAELAAAGSPLALGTDSHAHIDLFEEARAVELDLRLMTGRRGHLGADALLRAATAAGMEALGWSAGVVAPGRLCDLVALDLSSMRLAGYDDDRAAAFVVYAAGAADVTHVVCSGRPVVWERRHTLIDDPAGALRDAIAPLWGDG